MVQFKSGKRNAMVHKYVCVVENIVKNDQGNEVEVIGLKSIDDTKQDFVVNSNDVSFAVEDQILGFLPFAEIKMKGFIIILIKRFLLCLN